MMKKSIAMNRFATGFCLAKTLSRYCCIAMFFLLTAISSQSQERTVTGRITDKDNAPMQGVLVTVKGSKVQTVTDGDGRYAIKAGRNSVIQFSSIGMVAQEVAVAEQNVVNLVLAESVSKLDDVVVIGYGNQSRRTITTAITKVGADKIENVPVTSVTTALQGKLAGVRIFQGEGGQPGSNAAITVRGGSSINRSNAPLVLIDGMVRELDDINPADIESVQVLKDASSTAVYGARASNGVVLVTTKRGATNKASIVFNANSGIVAPWRYMDMGNAEEFITMTRIAANRSPRRGDLTGQFPYGTGNASNSPWSLRMLNPGETVPSGYLSMPDPLDKSKTLIYQDNDFQRLTLRSAWEQNYNLSASGGSKDIKYAGSLSYADIDGTSIGSAYSRFTGRANVDFRLSEKLTLTTRVDHSYSTTNNDPSSADIFSRSIWLTPVARLYFDDGTFAPGQNATFSSPQWYNDVHDRKTNVYRTGFGTNLNWNIAPGLEAKVSGDYFIRNRVFEGFEKGNVFNTNRSSVFEYNQSRSLQFEGTLSYTKRLGERHNLNSIVGVSRLFLDDLDATSESRGASSDNVVTQNAGPIKFNATSTRSEDLLLGFFGRVNYDFDRKYLLGVSLRRDVSSKFAEDMRVGYFPGVSAGWMISEEAFMKSVKFINTLKLRGSLGQTGNNAIDRYSYGGRYSVNNTYFGAAGAVSTTMPNPSLTWETTNQFDVGLDIGLFKGDRVSILLDYYDKRTKNLLFNVPLPNESGYNNIDRNIGEVRFYGFEMELKARVVSRKNFNWNVDFNFGYNMNRVLKLPDNGVDRNRIGGIFDPATGRGVGGLAVGERLGQIIGYKSDFIIDNMQQAAAARFDELAAGWSPVDNRLVRGRKIPGDMEWVDFNGDNRINNFDQTVLGYLTPPVTGGFGNNVTFDNFEITLFMDYAVGHSIADGVIRRAHGNVTGSSYSLLRESLTMSWEQEGDFASGKATMPRFDVLDQTQQQNFNRDNDRSVYRGDFLCVRELRVAYRLPQKVVSFLRIKRMDISLSGQNLHYFTRYPGWATENSSASTFNDNTYPVARKLMFGLKMNL